LTDTDKVNSTGKYATKYNSQKVNNANYTKPNLHWLSHISLTGFITTCKKLRQPYFVGLQAINFVNP